MHKGFVLSSCNNADFLSLHSWCNFHGPKKAFSMCITGKRILLKYGIHFYLQTPWKESVFRIRSVQSRKKSKVWLFYFYPKFCMFNRTSAFTASKTLRTESRHFDYACCIGKYVDSAALQGFKDSDKKKQKKHKKQYPDIYVYFKLCKNKNPFLIRS